MKYLSVCSGIEAATVAWHHLGWTPAAFAEVEPFPSAVLAHHYKDTPNLGDMTKYESWNLEPIDLLVGGTPCQSFSVAGLRKGLADPRGNLMLTYLGIADSLRPKWIVWENVPGVLSSNAGRDFGTFLGALVELGYGFAYRVLDAQWFGVAQRRRRVFVIGYLGDASRAAKVLFERESVCRNPAPSREARKGVTGNVAPSLTASNDPSRSPQSSEITQQVNAILEAQVAACLRSGGAGGVPSSRGEHLVVGALCSDSHPGSYSGQDAYTGRLIATAFEPGIAGREGNESRFTHEVTGTLRKAMGDNQTAVALYENHSIDSRIKGPLEVSPSCRSAFGTGGGNIPLVHSTAIGTDCYNGAITGDVAATLGTPGSSVNASGPTVMQSTAVRRLTPTECERLQGFPDGYTAIPWKKKSADQCPDGPRYKALGNSMAVPVMKWIGERIDKVEKGTL